MNYRIATLLAEKSLTGTGTEPISIKVSDPISRIVIGYRVTKGDHGMHAPAYADVSKIELVSGSDVLHSLNGGENQALCIYDRKVPTMSHGQHMASMSQYSTFGIDFGRFLNDPRLALDPTKFEDLTLNITYDVDVSDTDATTAYLEAWAHLFDEKVISPEGFLTAKEQKNYTPGASGTFEYTNLPRDHVLRKLLVRGYRSGYEPWNVLINARLDEDMDKRVPFDLELEDYYRTMKGVWPRVVENVSLWGEAGGDDFYFTPTDYWANLLLMSQGASPDTYINASNMRGGKATIVSAGNLQNVGIASGYLPNHCYEFAFGDPQDIADWYNVQRIGQLQLTLKSGANGDSGTAQIVTQQLRRY